MDKYYLVVIKDDSESMTAYNTLKAARAAYYAELAYCSNFDMNVSVLTLTAEGQTIDRTVMKKTPEPEPETDETEE